MTLREESKQLLQLGIRAGQLNAVMGRGTRGCATAFAVCVCVCVCVQVTWHEASYSALWNWLHCVRIAEKDDDPTRSPAGATPAVRPSSCTKRPLKYTYTHISTYITTRHTTPYHTISIYIYNHKYKYVHMYIFIYKYVHILYANI